MLVLLQVQQGLYAASNGEELTAAGNAFVSHITERVRYLEVTLQVKSSSSKQHKPHHLSSSSTHTLPLP